MALDSQDITCRRNVEKDDDGGRTAGSEKLERLR